MGEEEDLAGLICSIFVFAFIAFFFTDFQTAVAAGNASNPVYPLVQQFPLVLIVIVGVVMIYFAYEVIGG